MARESSVHIAPTAISSPPDTTSAPSPTWQDRDSDPAQDIVQPFDSSTYNSSYGSPPLSSWPLGACQERLFPTSDGLYLIPSFSAHLAHLHDAGGFQQPEQFTALPPWPVRIESRTTSASYWTQAAVSECLSSQYSPAACSCWSHSHEQVMRSVSSIESPLSSYPSSHSSPHIGFDGCHEDVAHPESMSAYLGQLRGLQAECQSFMVPPSSTSNTPGRTLAPQIGERTQTTSPNRKSPTRKYLRTHICVQCGRHFDKKCNLNSHYQTHCLHRRVPVLCNFDGCRRPFGRKADLNRHIRSAHNNEYYPCPNCPKTFGRPDSLARHIKGACHPEQILDCLAPILEASASDEGIPSETQKRHLLDK